VTQPTLIQLSRRLAAGQTTSRALVEESLARIADPAGEGARAFLSVYAGRARAEADAIDAARAKGSSLPRFAGVPLSIKDLFDVEGEPTRAGSRALAGAPPAPADAETVALARRAGFVILGKTNMTEFAYSAFGVNPHYGTPLSPWDRARGRVPGGSTSGGAVSVADGMTPAALGTDTGGSCRIPAAFCGIVGFRPTQGRVSREGVVPLAPSLDSVGPLANSVSCCAAFDSILSGGPGDDEPPAPLASLAVGVIEGYVDESLGASVAAAFADALARLARAGAKLTPVRLPELAELPHIYRNGSIVEFEAFAVHRARLQTSAAQYDPWVLARLEGGRGKSAADYMDLLGHRARVRAAVDGKTRGFDALALPTVPIAPPALDELGDLAASRTLNALILRNTAIANFLDRPAISIPCHPPGGAPAGFMLMGEAGFDRRLLAAARGAEEAVRGVQSSSAGARA
jgi:aspartyl-tRNA(Asn)/glutamyl-tRNA(Gln) amidotransferase subunit A